MKKNELRALLAVTVIAVPLVFTTGCGKKTEAPADTVVTETVTETPIPETIEEDLADEGIEVTPTPEAEETLDESMAGTYYVISEDGIPAYGENDLGSEVVETIPYDTEVTVLGMSTETNLFKVQLTASDDSTEANSLWVSSEFLDTVRGGYTPSDDESEAPSEDPTAPTTENTSDLPSSFAGQDWYEALSPEEKAAVDEALNNAHNGVGGVDPNWADGTGATQGTGESPTMSDSVLGDGSGIPNHTVE